MSPRPRRSSDAELLAATGRVMSRLGPSRLTLADVAKEAGLAPATLVQRFGSKRGLLLAVVKQSTDSVGECFARVRAAHGSPLATLYAAMNEMTQHCETPEALANSLAFLEIDLIDPDFHRYALQNSRAMLAGFRALLEEAAVAGELLPCNTARLARLLQAACSGSMLSWAIHREDSLATWLRQDLDTLLAPYRAAGLIRRAGASRKPKITKRKH